MDLKQLPKVELHLHLDGSLSYTAVSTIDPTVTIDDYRQNFVAPAKCTDLVDFLSRITRSVAIMQTKEQLRIAVWDLFQQLAADNVIYAEIRFAPLLHTTRGLSPREVAAAVESATTQAIHSTGIEARLILCTLRHFSAEQSLESVKLVEAFRGTTVVGFDIAADEAGYPIDAHIASFQYANEHGIPCTAHAGEARGPNSVWETLKNFAPARLGHGVRSIEDPRLIDHLRLRQIHLEICPTCNVQTDIYPTLSAHPIDTLYRSGLSLGVSTDTRTLVNITLTEQYEQLHHEFNWQEEDFLRCNQYALQAAFIPDDLRQKLLARLI